MTTRTQVTIVDAGYRSTHYWVVGDSSGALTSWRRLVEMGARRVYPAHRPVWALHASSVV